MAYSADSFVADEQPTTAKWNKLWSNDASFNDGTGIGTSVITNSQLAAGVLVQGVGTSSTAASTGTTIIPYDDTIPQNTEGDQYMSLAITPKSVTNTLIIYFTGMFAVSTGSNNMVISLFQDTTANGLATGVFNMPTASQPSTVKMDHTMSAGTTSATTFKVRAGGNSAGTTTNNGITGSRFFGTTTKTVMTILEFKS